jgi:type II secretory pathway pseudopilin PulG
MMGRRGATLVELMVLLVILGVVLVVTAPGHRRQSRGRTSARDVLDSLRWQATMKGRPATASLRDSGRVIRLTAWPDGLVLSDTSQSAGTPLARSGHVGH